MTKFEDIFLTHIPSEFNWLFYRSDWKIIEVWRFADNPRKITIAILTNTHIYKAIFTKRDRKIDFELGEPLSVFEWVFDESIHIAIFHEKEYPTLILKSDIGFGITDYSLLPEGTLVKILPLYDYYGEKISRYGQHILKRNGLLLKNVFLRFQYFKRKYIYVAAIFIYRGRKRVIHDVRQLINKLLSWYVYYDE